MSLILNQRNAKARETFKLWQNKAFSPSLVKTAEAIGINYHTLKTWLGGYSNTNIYNLKKIEEFLSVQMDKQDRIDKHKAYMEQYMRYKQKREQEKWEERQTI